MDPVKPIDAHAVTEAARDIAGVQSEHELDDYAALLSRLRVKRSGAILAELRRMSVRVLEKHPQLRSDPVAATSWGIKLGLIIGVRAGSSGAERAMDTAGMDPVVAGIAALLHQDDPTLDDDAARAARVGVGMGYAVGHRAARIQA